MSGSLAPVAIPRDVLIEIYRESRKAFPLECCGWISGAAAEPGVATVLRACKNQQDGGQHPTQAARGSETAYVIAGEDLLALNRSFDEETPARVIYHSHPNGRAYLSETDRQVATSPWGDGPTYPVQQLVVGIDEARVVEAALFAWSDESESFVEISRFEGEAI